MPRARKAASLTATQEKDDLCILNCPPIKDHLGHASEHLAAMLTSRSLPSKERREGLKLLNLIRKAQKHVQACQFQARSADCLPERR
jgi:hypothetical protein